MSFRNIFGVFAFIPLGILGITPQAYGQCVNNCSFVYSSGTFTPIYVPGSTATDVSGLNNSGQVFGSYYSKGSDATQGFIYSDGSYSTFDVPAASSTSISDVSNSGEIIGCYNDAFGTHGFIYQNGTYTTLAEIPGSLPGSTYPYEVNESGEILGGYYQPFQPGIGHYGATPFLYINGVYTTLNDPPGPSPHPYISASGVNNEGQVVGYYDDANNTGLGFLYSGGVYTSFSVPENPDIVSARINDAGEILVSTFDGSSFVDVNGVYTQIEFPGAVATYATDLNNCGQVIGFYTNNYIDYFGFIDTNGVFETLDAGAPQTFLDAINDSGEVLGGFTIAVPEPSTWAMMLLGFAGLGYAGYRQPRALRVAV